MSTKILDIPYYSQFRDIKREEWHSHACGVVCVAMTLAFINVRVDIDNLIDEAIFVKGQIDGKWTHNALALLARNHGLLAYPQEFRTVEINLVDKSCHPSSYANEFQKAGLSKIVSALDAGIPTIVSVREGFATNKSSHNILIVGYEKAESANTDDQPKHASITHLYAHDPDTREYEKENMKVEIAKFFEYWRLYAVFFEKLR
jgi:hypothetical protein